MQLFWQIYLFLISSTCVGDVYAHHQEHLTVFTASDIVHRYCYWLVSWMRWNCTDDAAGRKHRQCIIPQDVTHSLVLLKMGKIIARNMLS